MTEFTMGQQLFYVADRQWANNEPKMETCHVTKIGRKWVYLNWRNFRFDKNTWEVDGGGFRSPGRVYLSAEDYHTQRNANIAWDKLFSRGWRGSRPVAVTEENIKEAAALLQISA